MLEGLSGCFRTGPKVGAISRARSGLRVALAVLERQVRLFAKTTGVRAVDDDASIGTVVTLAFRPTVHDPTSSTSSRDVPMGRLCTNTTAGIVRRDRQQYTSRRRRSAESLGPSGYRSETSGPLDVTAKLSCTGCLKLQKSCRLPPP